MPAKKKISPEERKQKAEERRFKIRINTVFTNVGFAHVATRDEEFEFRGRKGEIDAIYIFNNLLVVSEDTCSKSSNIGDHLNKKALFFDHLLNNKNDFVDFVRTTFLKPKNIKYLDDYHSSEVVLSFAYCSRERIESSHVAKHPQINFLHHTELRYFENLVKTIRRSARFEFLKFLRFELRDLELTTLTQEAKKYDCFVLPEPPSGFPSDHKIVAFYADPSSLMELAYVLRKDSWRDLDGLYQRMLVKNKIKSMREYLASEGRVYINNVIVSLPNSVRFLDKKTGHTVDPSGLTKNTYLQVELLREFNSVGLIDGQHRVFSYYEGSDQYEDTIARKRVKQQLLVTGVIFPENLTDEERAKFEAKLFLEINDRQTRTKGDLRQAIQVIVNPYNSVAVAKAIVNKMSMSGPLAGLLEAHYFGDGTIKTTSIVSYGLSHIVTFRGNVPQYSLYNLWNSAQKTVLGNTDDLAAWNEYVGFCTSEINAFFEGFKINIVRRGQWATNKKKSKALVTTSINGLIYCLRLLVANQKLGDRNYYEKCFSKLSIDFSPSKFPYKSSHWKSFGTKIANDCFGIC